MDGGCYRISHRDAILFGGRDGRSAADAYEHSSGQTDGDDLGSHVFLLISYERPPDYSFRYRLLLRNLLFFRPEAQGGFTDDRVKQQKHCW